MSDLRPGPWPLLDRTFTRIRARGPAEPIRLAYDRAKEFVSSRETLIFLARPADDGPASSGKWPDLELHKSSIGDAADYARWIGTDSRRTFAARLSPHTRCYLVRHGGRVVHATWVTTKESWVRELRRYFRVPAGEAYVYESFTRADARGMGIYPFALTSLCYDLAAEGVRHVWVGVEESNGASLRAVTKAGFEPAFRVYYSRRWGRLSVELTPDAEETCPGCLEAI